MLTMRPPTQAAVLRFIQSLKDTPFTYDQVGMTTEKSMPSGFDVDKYQKALGHGAETYNKAKDCIRRWLMFPPEMATLFWPDQSILVGAEVAVLFRAGPLWSLNPCRIVSRCEDEQSANQIHRFGFSYGTLAGHLECGEERFTVTWSPIDDSVYYELLAISRPNHLLTKLGYPYARRVQARFRRLSGESVSQAISCAATAVCRR
ncbi:MAG: DUF1990 domain-containing protein [Planctomycetales bacterium]|nr:DUF1990 domain-containing protein [Planctomycetales bacterium]